MYSISCTSDSRHRFGYSSSALHPADGGRCRDKGTMSLEFARTFETYRRKSRSIVERAGETDGAQERSKKIRSRVTKRVARQLKRTRSDEIPENNGRIGAKLSADVVRDGEEKEVGKGRKAEGDEDAKNGRIERFSAKGRGREGLGRDVYM